MERLSSLDAAFLYIEDAADAMHIGSCSIFAEPAPSHEEFVASVAGKLPLVPRYRQRVQFVPGDLGRPLWVDDASFSIEYHIRRTALPAPGDTAQLRTLAARLMSQRLDRRRPLWEMWVVEGLQDRRWAVVYKVHHAMVDGIAATDLLTVILDQTQEPSRPIPDRWHPRHQPNAVELLADAAVDRIANPYEQLRGLRALWAAPRLLLGAAAATAGLLRSLAGDGGGDWSINGPIGQYRRWEWASITLADVRAARRELGGTVNDVVLEVVTRGFRDLLLHRGEDVENRTVRSFVPVSVRAPNERGEYNNRVSGVIAELPVGTADPLMRLQALRQQMDRHKRSGQAVGGAVLVGLSGFAPPMLLALGTRATWGRVPMGGINTVTTNVPGPQVPLYSCGRELEETYPYVGIGANVRVTIAIFSYCGTLYFGISGDWDSMPDLEVLSRGIHAGMRELLRAAGVRPARSPAASGTRRTRSSARRASAAAS